VEAALPWEHVHTSPHKGHAIAGLENAASRGGAIFPSVIPAWYLASSPEIDGR